MSGTSFTTPGVTTRKNHLQIIRVICKSEGKDKAIRYWLRECPRISRKAFEEACK